MLLEEQVSELLSRCKKITGEHLKQLMGNLKNAEHRSAAIWELIVIEACSNIGKVEYEPGTGPAPDIKLILPDSSIIWIEIAYLKKRFWQEEQKMNNVTRWLSQEAKKHNINPSKISYNFHGEKTKAGTKYILPSEHDKKKFLNSLEVKSFFKDIKQNSIYDHHLSHNEFTFNVYFNPHKKDDSAISISKSLLENPTDIREHALYRVLKSKATQHTMNEKRIICVGSDQSMATNNFTYNRDIRPSEILNIIFSKNKTISGVLLIDIENKPNIGPQKIANGFLYSNGTSIVPLSEEDTKSLNQLNFNQWKYTWSLPNSKRRGKEEFPKLGGNIQFNGNNVIKIPLSKLSEALLGKSNLIEGYNISEQINNLIQNGKIVSISIEKGSIEQGIDDKAVFEIQLSRKIFN